MMETPSISGSAHTHSVYGLGAQGIGAQNCGMLNGQQMGMLQGQANIGAQITGYQGSMADLLRLQQRHSVSPIATSQEDTMVTRRLVQVFIADPDENVPLEQSLLYSGDQKLTDATDQELFFEIDIKSILDKHNSSRVKIINKKVKERTEHLEPEKIRDLKMVVVNVASF